MLSLHFLNPDAAQSVDSTGVTFEIVEVEADLVAVSSSDKICTFTMSLVTFSPSNEGFLKDWRRCEERSTSLSLVPTPLESSESRLASLESIGGGPGGPVSRLERPSLRDDGGRDEALALSPLSPEFLPPRLPPLDDEVLCVG